MTPPLTPDHLAELRRLRRIAREAQATYVGRHWPSMEDMRRDGIGHGLVEDRDHERFIRRYLDTFQPEFMVAFLEAASEAARREARVRTALEIIAAEPEKAPDAIGVTARNIARAALQENP